MSTGGGLVFGGGTNDRMFRAFDAKTGDVVWETQLNSGVIGVPSSFEVDGKQYIAVQSGWGIDAQGMQTRLAASIPTSSCLGPGADRRRDLGLRTSRLDQVAAAGFPAAARFRPGIPVRLSSSA